MATLTGAKPHPIYLAGRWVDSPDPLTVHNPADPENPAGSTYNATAEQYEEAVQAAVRAFEITRKLPAYERGAALRRGRAAFGVGRRLLDGDAVLVVGRHPPAVGRVRLADVDVDELDAVAVLPL